MISDGCLLDIRSPETDVIPGVKGAKYVTKYTYPSLSLSLCVCVCVCVRSTGLTAAAMAEAMKLQKMKLMAMNNIHGAGSQNGTESENEELNSSAGQSHTYKDTLKVHWIILFLLTEKVWLKVYVFLNLLQKVFNHIKAFYYIHYR